MSVTSAGVQPVPRGIVSHIGRSARDWLPGLVVLVVGVAAWEGLVRGLDIQRFLLPPPSAILETLNERKGELWNAGLFTFREALGGFVIGSGAAILAALTLARWRSLGGALMPYAIAANAVPIIAFAPIMNNWFGLLNPASKMAIAATICFFPVMVNALRGLTSVRPSSIELMRSYAAGEWEIFRRVRIPTSLPFLFTGLKVASVLSMIGAVVGEYFGGSREALGVVIKNSAALFLFEQAWAAIVVASLFGVAFYLAIVLAEKLVMRRYPSALETS
jgi:NitT/TauT family transport system permease protein